MEVHNAQQQDQQHGQARRPDERPSRGDLVNQVTLIGYLVAAPELRETASGQHVTTVRVATNGRSHAEFHDLVLWGQRRESRHRDHP